MVKKLKIGSLAPYQGKPANRGLRASEHFDPLAMLQVPYQATFALPCNGT
jgi:hypothetical protein